MKISPGDTSSSPPPPEELQIDQIVDLVRQICVTGSNLNLYSFKHAVSRKNLEGTLRTLTELLRGRGRITLNISKDTLLFEGFPIEERNPMVAKLARDLRNLHVSGVTFKEGITLKELAIYFKLVSMKRADLEKMGGTQEILEKAGVTNIGVNQDRYILLDKDQKVVSSSAHVAEGFSEGSESIKKEFIQELWDALMKKKVDRDWLLEEIRTDPAQAANQIVALLKYFDDQETIQSQEQRQAGLDSLMGSIETLGARLNERETGQDGDEDQQTLAQSMLVLEQELKSRSAGLKTSRSVSRFIEQITSTVTAFIDNLQTNQIVKEYLRDEKGLKRTEQLLKKVLKREESDQIMPRLQKLLAEKGLTEKDFGHLLDQFSGQKKKSPQKRRRVSKPVEERIQKALGEKIKGLQNPAEVTAYLSGLVQREVQTRLKESNLEKAHLTVVIDRMSRVMSSAGLSLVVIDKDGVCVTTTPLARAVLGTGKEIKIAEELRKFLVTEESRSSYAREAFLKRQSPDNKSAFQKILNAFDHAILDDDGDLMGVIFKKEPEQNPQ